MNQLIPTRSRLVGNARLLCAVMLLIAFLSAGTPLLASSSSGPAACARACCAGKAPHAAGSCAHGSCHASLSSRRTSPNQGRRISQRTEQLCGVPRRIETKSLERAGSLEKTSRRLTGGTPVPRTYARQNNSNHSSVSLASLSRPCQPECGGCSSSFTNSNQQRNTATVAQADRPRSPSNIRLADLAYRSSQSFDILCRLCGPRGPPFSLLLIT
jgi:hypothetical protein